MIDQRNGNDVFLSWIDGGVGLRSVTIFLMSYYQDGEIDYNVRIYGEPLESNDFAFGDLTADSELAYT